MCFILVWALGAPPIGQIKKFGILNCCPTPVYINNWVKGMLSPGFKLVHASLSDNFIPAHYFVEQAINTIYEYPNKKYPILIYDAFYCWNICTKKLPFKEAKYLNIHKSKQPRQTGPTKEKGIRSTLVEIFTLSKWYSGVRYSTVCANSKCQIET